MAVQSDLGQLRFITCGSVDDGKSTLIGRLLYDARLIPSDHLAGLARDSLRHGTTGQDLDFALLLDGLEAEREQGITIDVAYRYFATSRRNFIVADTPGHEQFTRNMVTGASTAQAAVLLVDARKGLLTQTRRHATLCHVLGVRHIVLAINKMDLVGHDRIRFEAIRQAFEDFASSRNISSIAAIPVSARDGDNVVYRSERMPWYKGPSLLAHLESIDTSASLRTRPLRFPVQLVRRPNASFRGYAGTVASGTLAAGDEVMIAGRGKTSRVQQIFGADGEQSEAEAGDAVVITLAQEIDVARGDLIVAPKAQPHFADQFTAHLVWFVDQALLAGRLYLMRIGTRWQLAKITLIKHRLDIDTQTEAAARSLAMNEIGLVNVSTASAVAFDNYDEDPATGAFILVDRVTNETAGAGMICHPLRRATNVRPEAALLDRDARAASKGQKPLCIWFTGLPGSGKSTVAKALELRLHDCGRHTMLLDGDNLRHGLNRDLGFTEADRVENIRRAGEVARLMTDAGLIVICSFISPFAMDRDMVRALFEPGSFVEVFMDTPIEECIRRDPKGLYAKALAGAIPNLTGVNSPYDRPQDPEIRIVFDAHGHKDREASIRGNVEKVIAFLERNAIGT